MQITDLLAQMGGLSSMAKELGLSESDARRGADALLPAVLGGLKKQAQGQPGGLEGLGGLLGKLGGGGLLDEVLAPAPTNVAPGNEVLGQIFGSKDVSRAVAQKASGSSGLDPALLRKMLPMVAMLATGLMAKQASSSNAAPQGPAAGGLGGLLGGLLGGQGKPGGGGLGGIMAMLDTDGDGNPLDDIMGMMGK
jgi:hypothetical protein